MSRAAYVLKVSIRIHDETSLEETSYEDAATVYSALAVALSNPLVTGIEVLTPNRRLPAVDPWPHLDPECIPGN